MGRLEVLVRVDDVVLSLKAVWSQNSFLFRGPFFYLDPSTDRRKPTHVVEGNLLYLNLLIQMSVISENTFTATSRLMFD